MNATNRIAATLTWLVTALSALAQDVQFASFTLQGGASGNATCQTSQQTITASCLNCQSFSCGSNCPFTNECQSQPFFIQASGGNGQTGGGLVDSDGAVVATLTADFSFGISQLSPEIDRVVVTTGGSATWCGSACWHGSLGSNVSASNGTSAQVTNSPNAPAKSYIMFGSGLFRTRTGTYGVVNPGGTFGLPANSPNHSVCDEYPQSSMNGRLEVIVSPHIPCATPSSWQLVEQRGNAPSPRVFAASAFDESQRKLVVFGGYIDEAPNFSDETWIWDGASWSLLVGARPPPRYSAAMAYGNGRILMHGGLTRRANGAIEPLNDTWELNLAAPTCLNSNSGWRQLTPSQQPTGTGRYGHKLAYHPTRFEFVLFGGDQRVWPDRQYMGDTWKWNGANWTPGPASGPSPRKDFGMVYDDLNGHIVLFGGTTGAPGSSYQSDTWTYNGTVWTQRSPTSAPPARDSHAMAFDALARRVVLYGGLGSAEPYVTWSWDGGTWTASPGPGTSAWIGSTLSYSPVQRALILFGGQSAGPSSLRNELWSYGTGRAVLTRQPANVVAPAGSLARLSADVANPAGLTLRWRKGDEALIDNARVSGSTTPVLSITNLNPSDTGTYSLMMVSNCGTTFSVGAKIRVGCTADLDNGSGNGVSDNAVTIEDLLFALRMFEAGDIRIDLDDDGNPAAGNSDGAVTIEDLIYFLSKFEAGC